MKKKQKRLVILKSQATTSAPTARVLPHVIEREAKQKGFTVAQYERLIAFELFLEGK